MGVIPGTTLLSTTELLLDAPVPLEGQNSSVDSRCQGVEVFSTEIGSLKTPQCHYRDMAYQVVMPNPPRFIPKILGYVRAHVCPGADPWDHLRLYLSVSSFIPKSVFGIGEIATFSLFGF